MKYFEEAKHLRKTYVQKVRSEITLCDSVAVLDIPYIHFRYIF